MSWKNWVPGYGDTSVRRKLRELDKAGVGVPMLIILFLQKSLEILLKKAGKKLPIPTSITFFLAAVIVFVLYVYDNQIRSKAEEAKEKVEEKKQ